MTEAKNKKREPLTHDEFVEVMLQNEEVYKALAKYELDDGQLTDEQYTKIRELAEYELNKSTGELQVKEQVLDIGLLNCFDNRDDAVKRMHTFEDPESFGILAMHTNENPVRSLFVPVKKEVLQQLMICNGIE
jgi:hypothetical protein